MKFFAIFTIAIVAAAQGKILPTKSYPVNPYATVGGRIVGGNATTINEYPFIGTLQYYGTHRCGGSAISTTAVVTAAHCTFNVDVKNLAFRFGSTARDSGGDVIPVSENIVHSQYNPSTLEYDVAVCKLARPMSFHREFVPAILPPYTVDAPIGAPCTVIGWGNTLDPSVPSDTLRHVDVEVVDRQACQKAYGDILVSETMMCAAVDGGGKDACQGDSGGPIVVNSVLAGLVSWGIGCAHELYPGVYTNLANPGIRSFVRLYA